MRHLRVWLAAAALLSAPITLRLQALTDSGDFLIANDANCQATTSCKTDEFSICPNKDGHDYIDYKCLSGCRVDAD